MKSLRTVLCIRHKEHRQRLGSLQTLKCIGKVLCTWALVVNSLRPLRCSALLTWVTCLQSWITSFLNTGRVLIVSDSTYEGAWLYTITSNIHGILLFLSSIKISVVKTKVTGAGEFVCVLNTSLWPSREERSCVYIGLMKQDDLSEEEEIDKISRAGVVGSCQSNPVWLSKWWLSELQSILIYCCVVVGFVCLWVFCLVGLGWFFVLFCFPRFAD